MPLSPLPNPAEFSRLVRDILNRLYDSSYLENHPLVNYLIPPENRKVQASQELRRIVLNAIQSIYPGKLTPEHTPDSRSYHILELRYINGLTVNETMKQLALGRSLFFLEQARALETLTDRLWAQASAIFEKQAVQPSDNLEGEPPMLSEMERLFKTDEWEMLDLCRLLIGLEPVLRAFVLSQGSTFTLSSCQPGKVIRGNRVLVRQIILCLVSTGLKLLQGGNVAVQLAEDEAPGLRIAVRSGGVAIHQDSLTDDQGISLEQCEYYLQAMSGSLSIDSTTGESWQAVLTWTPAAPRLLLVIDDHPDMIELIQRYLGGLDWNVIGARDGEEAKAILHSIPRLPDVIILDVILPKEDGWEFLLSLKTDERTRLIPVVVCSALHEPGLVSALGGSGYLAKPLTRPALLESLQNVGLVLNAP